MFLLIIDEQYTCELHLGSHVINNGFIIIYYYTVNVKLQEKYIQI